MGSVITRQTVYRGGMSSLDRIFLQGEDAITRQNLFTGEECHHQTEFVYRVMSSLDNLLTGEGCLHQTESAYRGGCHHQTICLQGEDDITRHNLFTRRMSSLERICLQREECHQQTEYVYRGNVITRQNLLTGGGMSSPDRICLQGEDVITRQNLFTGEECHHQTEYVYRGNVSSLDKISLKGECHH